MEEKSNEITKNTEQIIRVLGGADFIMRIQAGRLLEEAQEIMRADVLFVTDPDGIVFLSPDVTQLDKPLQDAGLYDEDKYHYYFKSMFDEKYTLCIGLSNEKISKIFPDCLDDSDDFFNDITKNGTLGVILTQKNLNTYSYFNIDGDIHTNEKISDVPFEIIPHKEGEDTDTLLFKGRKYPVYHQTIDLPYWGEMTIYLVECNYSLKALFPLLIIFIVFSVSSYLLYKYFYFARKQVATGQAYHRQALPALLIALTVMIGFILYTVTLLLLLRCLFCVGVDLRGLIASAGVVATIIGFGSQTLISDNLNGMQTILSQKYRVGDIIEIGGFRGMVQEIGLRFTRLVSRSGDVVVYNNSAIKNMVNKTSELSRVWADVEVRSDQSVTAVESIVMNALPKMTSILYNIETPVMYGGIVDRNETATLSVYLSTVMPN